ncbi:hypothetical protein BDQ12DRAFT_322981 [Crucibulum laeve]|uniref:Macrofage activating glycoprotein n=1 Tax=Crucibulum laeve TaxID=68775 RepID=A0A5C3M2J3_9AGAR|nr:hypothetical protein BDQ12DRAFT_322981 [Crucibulum laeve]
MSPVTLSSLAALAALTLVSAQSTFPPTPLASKTFAYPTGIPYMVDTDQGLIRGFQKGYNICNGTTQNQDSLCQTSFMNSIDDFCLWAPSEPDSLVANTEGEMVAWCTKPGHGTRLIPEGALTGVQFIKTPAYVAVIGFVDQAKINIAAGTFGGEMDPHGADLRGNPMGGLVYSNSFSGGGSNFQQVIEWHNFMGGGAFCMKACDPANPDAAHFCEHRLDRIGCNFNVPNNAQNGTFESCDGENQDFPGVYTVNGQVMTYTQPPEDQGAIQTMPYTARVPATSNCVQKSSTELYAALATVTAASGSSSASVSGSGASASVTKSGSSSKPTSGTASATGSAASGSATSNEAATLAISGVSLLGVVFSALFLS